jgi:hypothetical protein
MHVTLVRFTLIDEPNPPLRCQLVLNHKFYKLKKYKIINQAIDNIIYVQMRDTATHQRRGLQDEDKTIK